MLFRIFIYTLSLSPLFFGSNRPWSWSLYALLIACFGCIYFMTFLGNKAPPNITVKSLKYPMSLALIPIVWAYIQASSWVPKSWIHPFWKLTATQLDHPLIGYISVTPDETITALMKLVSYFFVFFLSVQFSRQFDKARRIFNTIAFIGVLYAVYGLIAFWGDYNTLFGFENAAYKTNVRSTFVNRNSYATYAGLSLLAVLPWLFERIKGCLIYGVKSHYGRQYFIENFFGRAWIPLAMLLILCTALFLSHSRGGFLSTLFAITVFFISAVLLGKLDKKKFVWILPVILLAGGLSFMNSGDKLMQRMEQISVEKSANGRLVVYDIVSHAITENFWLGVGYGSFEKSFRLYRDESVRGYYKEAHNTYLENLFELGVLQASALFIALLWVAINCLQGARKRQRHWEYPLLGFAATALVGAHSCVDFSLQMPAVAYTYALMMGAAFAQSLPQQLRIASYKELLKK